MGVPRGHLAIYARSSSDPFRPARALSFRTRRRRPVAGALYAALALVALALVLSHVL